MRSSTGGPCCHCGTSQTPCWRKGPPEKPTLCNACGSRYLVKGSLAGYFPGARRSSVNTTRSDVPQVHSVVVTKGPRKAALQSSAGAKRKSYDVDGFDGEAQRLYNEYDALEALRYSFFFSGQACFGQADGIVVTNLGSSAKGHHEEDCFRKEAQYLDTSSDDYQEPGHDAVVIRALAATTATDISGPQPAMFHRRPRKQLRPVACSC